MIVEITEIYRLLSPAQRLLGIDLGEKNIGISISDSTIRVATPLTTIKSKKFSVDALLIEKICNDYNIGGVIIGWPLNMDGSISKRCQATRQWALNLEYRGFNIPICFFDERLSTISIENEMVKKLDTSRNKRKEQIDKMAANLILQNAINHINKEI